MRIGVVGYSGGKFDKIEAIDMLKQGLGTFNKLNPESDEMTWVVSGYTDIGIPALAYRLAKKRGWMTKGIACGKATEYKCYPCSVVELYGNDWGDESKYFLEDIDVMLRVGGGEQSLEEVEAFKRRDDFEPWKLIEFELERED